MFGGRHWLVEFGAQVAMEAFRHGKDVVLYEC